ncbi:MAG: methionine--tRNA ligase [Planctomycetota bacterium]|nr:methionine--tRNA ligase [Planctomycetota bacterium]
MAEPAETAYITTPIYYVNDRPHIGHAYTTTLCDIWARSMRAGGRDVFFLTGTDEHGVKVEKSARARGITPLELANENAAEFRKVMDLFELTYDDFIRTTEARHVSQVQTAVRRLLESGDVYLGEFEGWYDEGQEEYHTETKAKELGYASPISGQPLVRATQTNYFFRLSAYQERLERLFGERPDFVRPEARRNEVLGRLRDGLQDVPITRTNFEWGIPVPGDEEHVIYVWIDALMNYATAVGMCEEPDGDRSRYWPADFHVIGKEILWFHAVIWPAVLMALGLPQPGCIYAHSFWISEGQKMSKSLGNFIDLEQLQGYMSTYGTDALRYFMATQGPQGATDSDFSRAQFHETYTTDLVNTVGNCASRTSAMVDKYLGGTCPARSGEGAVGALDWSDFTSGQVREHLDAMDRFELGRAIEAAMRIIRRVDTYINETQPFKLARDPEESGQVAGILYDCLEAIRIASCLLESTMPARIAELRAAWNLGAASGDLEAECGWGRLEPGTVISKVALFPRLELEEQA